MRAIHIFACRCGSRYKAVTEINKDERAARLAGQEKMPFVCPSCSDRIGIDGHIVSVELEVQPEIWRRVELQSLE
jgi:hypothetical protein